MTARNLLRRLLFRVKFQFFAKQRISRDDSVTLFGFALIVPRTVFHPALYYSSKFFGQYLRTISLTGKSLLDMGCGSGFLSLIAASGGACVTSVDINPKAVEAAAENARRNNLQNQITAYLGNLFGPLERRKFDYIIANPPFYEGEPKDLSDHAWKSGTNMIFFESLAKLSTDHLNDNGKIIYVISSDTDVQFAATVFAKNGFLVRAVKSRKLLFETLYIVEAARNI